MHIARWLSIAIVLSHQQVAKQFDIPDHNTDPRMMGPVTDPVARPTADYQWWPAVGEPLAR